MVVNIHQNRLNYLKNTTLAIKPTNSPILIDRILVWHGFGEDLIKHHEIVQPFFVIHCLSCNGFEWSKSVFD